MLEVLKDPFGKNKPKTKPYLNKNSRGSYAEVNDNLESKTNHIISQLENKRMHLSMVLKL